MSTKVTPIELRKLRKSEQQQAIEFCERHEKSAEDVAGITYEAGSPFVNGTLTFAMRNYDGDGVLILTADGAETYDEQVELVGEMPDWWERVAVVVQP